MFPPRVRLLLWIAAVCLVLFTVTGFFVLPPIVRSQLEKRLTAQLGRTVTVGKVRINPFTPSVTVEKFDIREADGAASFVGWDRLYVKVGVLPLLVGAWVVEAVELDGLRVRAAINADGSMNFSDLIAKFNGPAAPAPSPATKAAAAAAPRPVRLGSFKLTGARIDFSDLSRSAPFRTTIGPLHFTLTGLTTAGDRQAPYGFEAVTEAGEKLAWQGWVSASPVRSAGEWRVENIILKKYAPYYAPLVRADLADGKLSLRGRYEINLDPKGQKLTVSDAVLGLRDLRILERATGQPAIELPALTVKGINLDGVARKGTISAVTLAGGKVSVRRDKDGTINLLAMLQPESPVPALAPAVPTTASTAAAAPLPDIRIGEIAVNDLQIDVADLAAARPAHLKVDHLQVSLKDVAPAAETPLKVHVALAWAPQGKVEVDGIATLRPSPSAILKVVVTDVELLPLSPYLEQFVNARLTQGAVSATGDVQFALAGSQASVTVAGEASVDKFAMVDGAHSEELAGFSRVAFSGVKLHTAPQLALSVGEVVVTDPYARVVVNADRTLNLAALAKAGVPPPPAVAPARPQSAAPPAPAPKIEIGKVSIAGGDFSFVDRSVEPNVKVVLGQFGGTISGLSADNPARADLALKGVVDGVGPVAMAGKLDPLATRKFMDLQVDLRGIELLPLSPYSGKYAGYELARGKLQVAVKLKLDGRQLDSTNVMTLDHFTFGQATNSPDATHLPVRLGVALLKDMDGKIVIDVPVGGNLDDPEFHISKVVWRVIGNLLTKAAVSPFSLLGSMFGGGSEELAWQEFAPGAAQWLPTEDKKLETLVKALTNRPGLNLGIEGDYDAAADAFVLKQQKLADRVRRQIWEAGHAVDPNILPPEQLTISPEDNAAMIKKLFDEKFPPGTPLGAPLPPPPVVAPPPAAKHGILRRVIDVVTFKGSSAPAAAPKPAASAEAAPASGDAPASGPSLAEMTARLADAMEVNDNDLRALGAARAQQVRDYFVQTGKIDPARLFLANVAAGATTQNKGPRVFLTLQ